MHSLGSGRNLNWCAQNPDGSSGGMSIFWGKQMIDLFEDMGNLLFPAALKVVKMV